MSHNTHANEISLSDEKTNKQKETKRGLFLKKVKETSKAAFLKVYKRLKLDKIPRPGTLRAGLGTRLGTLRARLGTLRAGLGLGPCVLGLGRCVLSFLKVELKRKTPTNNLKRGQLEFYNTRIKI